MDPLSMTASIIALLQVTGAVTGYINDLWNASEEQQSVAMEAGYLYGVLTILRFRVSSVQSKQDPWFSQLKALSKVDGPLEQMQKSLDLVKISLQPQTSITEQIKAAIRWQWSKAEVRELLRRMQHLKSLVDFALASDHFTLSQNIHSGVEDLSEKVNQIDLRAQELQDHVNRGVQGRISSWLQLPDPSLNFQAAQQLRHGDTGSWLLSHPKFIEWLSLGSSMIWLHGKAGCGKTILSSTLIKALRNNAGSIPIAYFYFDFRDISKQSPSKAMRSILFQIAVSLGNLGSLELLYNRHHQGSQQPSDETIQHLLKEMITAEQPAYIVLDALDECTDREILLDILRDLHEQQGFRFALMSRRERDIEEQLVSVMPLSIDIESSLVDRDIAVYIQEQVNADARLKKWSPDIREEIVSTLTSKANGMFRWAYCQLEAIRKCLQVGKLRKTLETLPRTLDEVYNRIMQNIEADEQLQDAVLIMQWMCFSVRPMTLVEAAEILTLQTAGIDAGFLSENRLADPHDLLVICSSLLDCIRQELDDEGFPAEWAELELRIVLEEQENHDIVRLAHFSVKEYLVSERCNFRGRFETDECNSIMAKGCLNYLLHTCEHGPMTRTMLKQYPLAKYASDNWVRHVKSLGSCPDDILDLVNRLLNHTNGILTWSRLSPTYVGTDWQLTSSNSKPPLHLAADTGIYEVTRSVLQRTPWSHEIYGNALIAACNTDDLRTVQLLLDSGADVNFEFRYKSYSRTALSMAVWKGDEVLVKLLLEAGANARIPDGLQLSYEKSPKHTEQLCYLLIDAGADLMQQFTPGLLHINVLRRILKKGVDIEARISQGMTVLQIVCRFGDVEKAELLIEAGADINAPYDYHESGWHYSTLLHSRFLSVLGLAVIEGHPPVVRSLIKSGARMYDEKYCQDILHLAARVGNVHTVTALLDGGADVNKASGRYGTPLHNASIYGHSAVVEKLLESGAKVNIQGGVLGTALQTACSHTRVLISIEVKSTLEFEATSDIHHNSISIVGKAPDWRIRLRLKFTTSSDPNKERQAEDQTDSTNQGANEDESEEDIEEQQEEIQDRVHRQDGKKTRLGSIVPIQRSNGNRNEAIIELVRPEVSHSIGHKFSPDEVGHNLVKDLCNILELPSDYSHKTDYRKVIRFELVSKPVPDLFTNIEEAQTEFVTQALLDLGAVIQPRSNQSSGGILSLEPRGPSIYDIRSRTLHYELVKMLVDAGADINARGGIYDFALQAIAHSGNLEACRLLLTHGADISLVGGVYGTALQAASAAFLENVPMVQLLLTADADVNVAAGEYGCALTAACYRGHINVVRILLNVGADVNLQGGTYGNPLQAACASSRASEELTRMLIEAGADILAEGGKFGSAYGACLSKRYQAAILVSEKQYRDISGGEKKDIEL